MFDRAARATWRVGATPYVDIAVLTALATLLQDVTSVSGAPSQLRDSSAALGSHDANRGDVHRKTALQFDRAVLCAFFGAELGLQSSIDFEGKTGFRQFDRSAGHSGIHSDWRQRVHLVTVSPARPTSLFRRLWKE